MTYADILFQQKVGQDKETLTYKVPEDLNVKEGQGVEVKLRNRSAHGIIFKLHNEKPSFRTIEISKIHDKQPLLSNDQLKLLKWIGKNYYSPIYKVLKSFIPKRILQNKPIRTRKKEEKESLKHEPKKLTSLQKETVDGIEKNKKNSFLIHGITGSGKTEVYCHLAKKHIENDEQVLLLVPEISLTPQTIEYFEKSIEIQATVIHSKLSEGEKYDAWQNIWKNKSKLIIGSRSAIFSPFQNLALIIIDEEHEFSYKQDQSPRYTTHEIIRKMQEHKPTLKAVFGSATPSVETKEKLKDTTFTLSKRIGKAVLPDIEIIDLREEFKKGNYSIFSESLRDSLNNILEQKRQAILFLNRRGAASSMVCRDCGEKIECQKCEIPMTYHSKTLNSPVLICHHCGIISSPPSTCPNCQSTNIRFLGIGTQKIESELKKEFPKAKVLRADKDTTSKKHDFKKIYHAFRDHKADILIGTQMIAKGLDLPKVDLVGVILADIGLNIPDFRSSERNFQLLTQVAGRAGRSEQKGKVIIQTYSPDNLSLEYCKNHDYKNFFEYEITQRKLMKNPPFSRLAKITIKSPNINTAKSKTEEVERVLWKIIRENKFTEEIEINTYPAYMAKLRGQYQYIILIKDKSQSKLIHKLLGKLPKNYIIEQNLIIDIDPISTT